MGGRENNVYVSKHLMVTLVVYNYKPASVGDDHKIV